MNINERNRKIAISRWKRVFKNETASITKGNRALLKKAAICGFLAGDGSVQVRKAKSFSHYQIDLFADDKKMLETYRGMIYDIYHKKPSISTRDNMHIARLCHKFIVLDLLKESKFGLKKWNLPKNLFKINNAKENWLRAFYSAEGYVNEKVIKTQSVNIKGIRSVSKLLSKLGIKNNYYEYTPKNKNHSKVGMVFINDKTYRRLFFDKIGFWHLRKEKILKQSLGL